MLYCDQIELMCCESVVIQWIKLNSCDVNLSILSCSRFDCISVAVEVELELKKVVLEMELQAPAGGTARPSSAWSWRAVVWRPIFFLFMKNYISLGCRYFFYKKLY
jgi:hypothetical protein